MKRSGFGISFSPSKGSGQLTLGGRILGTLFFLVFFLMGSFFEVMVVRELIEVVRSYSWPQVPCRILRSEVKPESGTYQFLVEYEYRVDSVVFKGDQCRRKPVSDSNYDKLFRLSQRFPAGTEQGCFVDPRNPTEAILQRDHLAFGLTILFPLLFVGVGAVGIWAMWTRWKPSVASSEPQPVSAPPRGRRFLVGFFAIFMLAGFGMAWPVLIRPIYKILDARRWIETPCTILHAEVRSHSDDDGTTYSVDIFYQYSMDNKTYRSNRYDFYGGSSSGYDRKEAIVQRYRTMPHPVCWVNPSDPTEAVLIRRPTAMVLLGLVPLVFAAVGCGGIYGVLRSGRRSRGSSIASWLPPISGDAPLRSMELATFGSAPFESPMSSEWVNLSASQGGRFGKFLAITLIAAFWNGIVSIFLVEAVNSFRKGHPHWFLALFLIPFVLVGLGLIAGLIHQFLALFNPRPKVQISPAAIPLGASARVRWEFRGRVRRIRQLSIRLTATEEIPNASEGGSKENRQTHFRQVCLDQELLTLTDSEEMTSGQIRVSIPADAMHSFHANNHRIVWALIFKGIIPRWPDLKDRFTITIVPQNHSRG